MKTIFKDIAIFVRTKKQIEWRKVPSLLICPDIGYGYMISTAAF